MNNKTNYNQLTLLLEVIATDLRCLTYWCLAIIDMIIVLICDTEDTLPFQLYVPGDGTSMEGRRQSSPTLCLHTV